MLRHRRVNLPSGAERCGLELQRLFKRFFLITVIPAEHNLLPQLKVIFISYTTISASRYIKQIENRSSPLPRIEQIFDDNKLIFRYNEKRQQFSLIEADYFLSTPLDDNDIYIFTEGQETSGLYICRICQSNKAGHIPGDSE